MSNKQIINLPPTFPLSTKKPCQAAYLEMGEGIPLLMLHGFMGEAGCWLPLMKQLQNHFHCISLDLLGFGASSKPEITYDVAIEVNFLHNFVQKLGLKQFYLLGHSFGGWVGSAYALKYPHALSGLILAAPAGIRDDSFCGRYDSLRPLLWKTPLIDLVLHLTTPLAKLIGKKANIEEIWSFRKNLMAQPVARSFLMTRLRPEDAVDTVEKQIHQLSLPTLVIAGELDETIPLWHCQTYASEIPKAQLQIISGADHSLPQNYSTEMANLIQRFK